MLTYKGYTAKLELDSENHIFHGEVIGITDVITFQGATAVEIETAFHDSVDDYLAFCEERGEEPDKVYSGKVLMRMSPELHRTAAMRAELAGASLNAWLVRCIEGCLADPWQGMERHIVGNVGSIRGVRNVGSLRGVMAGDAMIEFVYGGERFVRDKGVID